GGRGCGGGAGPACRIEVIDAVPGGAATNAAPVPRSASSIPPLARGRSTPELAWIADHRLAWVPRRYTCTAVPRRTHTERPLSAMAKRRTPASEAEATRG